MTTLVTKMAFFTTEQMELDVKIFSNVNMQYKCHVTGDAYDWSH
jgi:hypothetical protein